MPTLLLLFACTGPKPSDEGDDTAPIASDFDVEVEVGEVQTVLVVRWTTEAPTAGTVTASFGGETLVRNEAASAKNHTLTFVGVPAETEVAIRVDAIGEDGSQSVGEGSAVTGALPDWVPELTLDIDDPEKSEGGYTLFTLISDTGAAILGVDEQARVVWYWPSSETLLDMTPFRARESIDGGAILYAYAASDPDDYGEVVRVPLAGGEPASTPVPASHTDFVEYTEGGYVALGWDVRAFGDRQILGDSLIEVAPDGTRREVWNVFDWFEPDLSQTWPDFYGRMKGVEDWSHLNGMSYDPATDTVLVSSTFNNAILEVDRASGDLAATITDGDGSDYVARGVLMSLPHSVQPIDGGLHVFSRNASDQCSQSMDVTLDDDAGTAQVTWSYEDPDCIHIDYLGSTLRLEGGNTLIGWSTSNRVDEVTADGELVWSASLDFGHAIGFLQHEVVIGE